jgi:hypothetical protein
MPLALSRGCDKNNLLRGPQSGKEYDLVIRAVAQDGKGGLIVTKSDSICDNHVWFDRPVKGYIEQSIIQYKAVLRRIGGYDGR